jgi:hypothetical protein
MPSTWNIFSIGRKPRNEDQLTEMLVWLVGAVPEVGQALVSLALDGTRVDGDLEITTQHGIAKGRLDALIIGPQLALIVESKIDSGYGDAQLARYLEWLAETHASRRNRALMTLTAHAAPWSDADRERAKTLAVVGSERLWEELHAALEPITTEDIVDALAGRLVGEFLEMLGEEGLIPVKPLERGELTGWPDAWAIVERFHAFFDACKPAIGEALGTPPSPNSWSKAASYTYQDYVYDDGSRIVVGLNCSEGERVPKPVRRSVPMLWVAVEAKHWPDWKEAKDRLEGATPDGWNTWHRWWGERPQIWRYLDDVIGEGTFEQQRDRLAATAAAAKQWLEGPQDPVRSAMSPGTGIS